MKLAILLLAALPALCLDNSVTIRNNFTGALTSWPIWHGRWFARGEILNYPRPYSTPSDTGTRAAITTWQSEVKNRWRDATVQRTITSARAGSPCWNTAGSGGCGTVSSIAIDANGIATVTFGAAHNLAVGDRLKVEQSGVTWTIGPMDNAIVHEVTSSTVAKYISRAIVGSTHVVSTTYNTGNTVTQVIDPLERATTCRYYSANHGFYRGESVTIASVGGVTPSSSTQVVTAVTRNEFVTNATCSGTYTSGGTATGPDFGSVQFALVAYVTTIPASGTTRVDWVNDANPCSAGNQTACNDAGLDKSEMIGLDWNFNIIATADVKSGETAAITTSAHTMLNAWDEEQTYCGPRYWARGPVITKIIVEYACAGALTYDFGWKIRPGTTFSSAVDAGDTQIHVADATDIDVSGNVTTLSGWSSGAATETMTPTSKTQQPTTCDGASITTGWCVTVTRATTGTAASYASGRGLGIKQWEDAPDANYKSLHPRFDLTFVAGGGVKGSVIVANEWVWKGQGLWYSIDLQTGETPASRLTKTTFKHPHLASWKIDTYDGTDAEFYCSDGDPDPDNCVGSTRTRRYLIDYNTAYLSYARILPEYQLYSTLTNALNTAATNFDSSDKGGFTSTGLGSGTFASYAGNSTAGSTSATKSMDGEEAYTLNSQQAMWLQNWSAAGYQLTFGDNVAGGGGNSEAQRHITWHTREDDATNPRYVMPGFGAAADSAFSRPISLYARPGFGMFISDDDDVTITSLDKRRTACSTSAAPALLGAIPTNSAASGSSGWPCWTANTAGLDGWGLTSLTPYTHQIDWNELAYLITADPRHLDSIQSYASWNSAGDGDVPDGRNVGRSLVQPEHINVQSRGQGGYVRALFAATVYTPNQPQFGSSVPDVATYYWNEKLWDAGLSKEGFFGITNGKMAELYPGEDLAGILAACPGNEQRLSSIWTYVYCGVAGGPTNPNPLGIMGRAASGACGQQWMNCADGYQESDMWYYHHTSMTWSRAAGLGLTMFDHSRRKFANWVFSIWSVSPPNWNPWMNDLSQYPFKKSGVFVQTLAEMYDGLLPTWASGARTDADWCHQPSVCSVTTDGYPRQWVADIHMLKDLSSVVSGNLDGCSGNCTYATTKAFIDTNLIPVIVNPTNVVKNDVLPYATVTDLNCATGPTSAVCTFTPPTTDACTYAVSTAFTDTLDADDTSDGGSTLSLRTINLSSLTVNQSYTLRVTCGQRTAADGTGRTFAEFETASVSGGITGRIGITGRVKVGQ